MILHIRCFFTNRFLRTVLFLFCVQRTRIDDVSYLSLNQKEIGARLLARRNALGLSQADVAGRMDVAVSTVQRAEAGTLNATIETLLAHCQALELPVSAILSTDRPVLKPTLHESINRTMQALELLKKEPLLCDIFEFNKTEIESLVAAVEVIKSQRAISSTASATKKRQNSR
jgi:transcriptional regulator with XRE-family HTH domain